jgi:hypothetical protein
MAGIGPIRQDWEPVVMRKKAPNAAANKDEKAVNAARRSGAEIDTTKKCRCPPFWFTPFFSLKHVASGFSIHSFLAIRPDLTDTGRRGDVRLIGCGGFTFVLRYFCRFLTVYALFEFDLALESDLRILSVCLSCVLGIYYIR